MAGDQPRGIGRRAASAVVLGGTLASCTLVSGVGSLHEVECASDCGEGGGDASADGRADGRMDASRETTADTATEGGPGSPDACSGDLKIDPHNCGRCGHDCVGGACAAGVCQPVTLATGITQPWGIAVDGTDVYFTDDDPAPAGSIYKCPLAGCVGAMPWVTNQAGPSRIALSTTAAYWTNFDNGTIGTCDKAACGSSSDLATGQDQPIGIAVDTTNVYWANSAGGSIIGCPLAGCGGMGPFFISNVEMDPVTVAVDMTGLYWVGGAGNVRFCAAGGCGGVPTTLASGEDDPYFIALFDGVIYWVDQVSAGSVRQCNEMGCGTVGTLSAANQPSGLAVDSSGAYWVDYVTPGTVQMCPLSGCGSGPMVLAEDLDEPFDVALGADAVYWTNAGGGTVMKVAKP